MRRVSFSYTGWIIGINVAVFVLFLILANSFGDDFLSFVALQPAAFLAGQNLWTLVTSMFMHGGLTHLFVNMLSLLFIGSFVEKLIGKKRFLWFYLGAGLFAGLLYVLLAGFFGGSETGAMLFGSPLTFAVGASGAIFGLGGLLAVLTPKLKVLIFFIIPMPMWIAMIAMLGVLWGASFFAGLPIGNVAHLGGLLVGVGYGFWLKHKYPRRTQAIARHFSR